MNLLKSLTGYLLGSGEKESLVQINGALYDRYKGNWRCLHPESSAVVKKSANAFHYNLIITREAQEDDVPEGEEEEEEQTFEFPIAENMQFAKDVGPITNGFSWTDINTGRRYLLELDDESTMSSLFQLTTCQCIYEAKHNKSSTDVPSEVVLKLCGTPPQDPSATPSTPLYPSLKEEPKTPSTPYTAAYTSTSTANTPQRTPQPAQPFTLPTPQQATPQQKLATPQPPKTATPQQATPQTKATPKTTTPTRKTPKNPLQQGTPTTRADDQAGFMSKIQEAAEETPKISLTVEGEEYEHITGVELFAFDETSGNFIQKEAHLMDASINFTGDEEVRAYKLYILDKGKATIAQAITSEMNPHHNKQDKTFVWSYSLGKTVWIWSMKFLKTEDYESFIAAFGVALWEANNNAVFKPKDVDLDYLINSFSDNPVNPNDISLERNDGTVDEVDLLDFDAMDINDKEEEEEEDEEEDEESEEEEDAGEDENDSDSEAVREFNSHSHNSALAVGAKSARSFVVRGSQIGVFKTDSNLKLDTMIKKIKDREGKFFSPKKLMLSDQDQNLLMLHPNQKNKLFKMDLHRSDVVEEWNVSDYYPVNEVLPTTKYAQTTPAQTVVGMNDIGFFYIDPRLNKEKMVDSKSYFYSGDKNPQLSCAATTDTGAMVVGTKRGDIRLFDSKTFGDGRATKADSLEARRPRAKTTLPGLGDPIIGIDVTEDGKWILATCRTYVLVIPTELPGGNNGFEKPMGKFKPVPRRLQLKREDLVKMGGKVNFTVAKFNTKDPTNPNAPPERSIVTSSGRFVITWNFKKVKQGICDQYNIQQYEDVVVADQFKFGEDEKVIVTLPNNVHLSKRSVRKVA